MIGFELQALRQRQLVYGFEIAYATPWIESTQLPIERGVARAREPAVIAKRPIDAQQAATLENFTDAAKEMADARPVHDVQRICAEDCVDAINWPGALHDIELERHANICGCLPRESCTESRQVFGAVGWLPDEMREVAREVHGMLTGPAADLQHAPTICECALEDPQDRILVALASDRNG